MKKPRYLFIVNKAVNELDFGLPLLWKLKNLDPNADITVLYFSFNKKKLLRRSHFYSSFLKDLGIPEFDLTNFLPFPASLLAQPLKNLFVTSGWDFQHANGYKKQNKFLLKWRIFKKLQVLECDIASFFDLKHSLYAFSSDYIFMTPRGVLHYPGRDALLDMTYEAKPKVILIPHGAFISDAYTNPVFSDRQTDPSIPIPDFCRYWYSCKAETTLDHYPSMINQSAYVGYPGLDSEWFQVLDQKFKHSKKKIKGSELRCLFIVRKFEVNASAHAVMDYSEFETMLRVVVEGLKATGKNIKLIVKPHPSNDYVGLEKLLNKIDYSNWEISYQSNYYEIANCDFVVAVPSTSVLLPGLYGLPTIIFNCSVKKQFDKWDYMVELFSGFKLLVNETWEFRSKLNQVIELLEPKNRQKLKDDMNEQQAFFRRHYPDGAIDLCLNEVSLKSHDKLK